ncbi:MAG: hypothetical protein ACRDQF_11570, partial [Thermocrispum sp.]
MPDRDDLEHRVDALEDQGRELRSRIVSAETDAAAARTLAAGADRDVGEVRAELRAHTSALNALRETQLEQGHTLAKHTTLLVAHGTILAEHGRVLDEHGRKLDANGRKLDANGRKLDANGRKLDANGRKLDVLGQKVDQHSR